LLRGLRLVRGDESELGMMRCSIVIVTFNGWPHVRRCLDAIDLDRSDGVEVVAVDNGSTDGVPQRIRASFPWVRLIESGSNLGFAAGCNLGIKNTFNEFVMLLNSDVVIQPGFINAMLAPFSEAPRLGASAAAMVFQSNPSIVASAGIEIFRNGLTLDQGLGTPRAQLVDGRQVFGASGGSAAFRRTALDDVGLFPEPYFMYLEDVDLAWRLRLRGWDTVLAANAVAEHASSASSGEGSPFKRRLLARNRIWMITRCVPSWLLARTWWRIVLYDALVIGSSPLRRDGSSIRGRLNALDGMRSRIAERRKIQAESIAKREDIERWIRAEPAPSEILRLRRVSRDFASS
jgi:GT2 family glycosyltransferase